MNKHPLLKAAVAALLSCLLVSCLRDSSKSDDGNVGQNPTGPLRIYFDPYALVDWATDQALLAQHHDHVGASTTRLMAYDNAGYNVVPLMDYSGVPAMSGSLKLRLWPVSSCVTEETTTRFRNIRLLIPNAEEVGIPQRHVSSPFLTEYIEYFDGATAGDPAPRYRSFRELVEMIRGRGGLPVLAHPWYSAQDVIDGPEAFGMEIYSAYIAAKRAAGDPDFVGEDRNEKLLNNWDAVLSTGRWWVGIAVNDHFGPYSAPDSTEPGLRDSGKILVYSSDATLESYRASFERGAFFAIRDNGVIKGGYPKVNSVSVAQDSVTIDAVGATGFRWISGGNVVGSEATLPFSALPRGSVYLRAEILGDAHVVYSQPFILRHADDINGDGKLTNADETACDDLDAGTLASTPELVAACAGRP